MGQGDLYSILGVSQSATVDEIKKAYRKLARKHHPDVNPGNRRAEDRFKEISAAFEVLSDSEKKRLYDEFGADGLRSGFNPDEARAYEQWQSRARATGGFNRQRVSFEDIFGGANFDLGDLFGAHGDGSGFSAAAGGRSRRGSDVHAAMTVTLREAVLGTERELSFDRPAACASCHGVGQQKGAPCARCGGSGEVDQPVRLKVKVPAGIADGHTIRLAGQGLPGSPGGPAGDLLIDVAVRPHPQLKREGNDLYLSVPVTVKEAMLGARIRVPTFQGTITLTVPPGSQNGQRLRVKGRGVAGAQKGDLYVVLDVRLPPAIRTGAEAKEAVEQLESMYEQDVRASLAI